MKLSRGGFFLIIFFFLFIWPSKTSGANSLDVVINEIAWMGTQVSYNDEWIELYNNTGSQINLSGWKLVAQDGVPEINLSGIIMANSFYLLERTDDDTVPGISADQIYTGALGNNGENLYLYDNFGNLIDSLNCSTGWFAGDNSTKQTMERKNSKISGSDQTNWQTSQNPGGTPKAPNSLGMKQEEKEVVSQPEEILPSPEPQLKDESPTKSNLEPLLQNQISVSEEQIYPSGVLINEILPSPTGSDANEEWIEIFNQNETEVDLSGWKITDTVGRITTYTFPQGSKISPRGFLVLSRPTTKITLNNDGDGISLIQPNGKILETIIYPKAPQGQSYSRTKENDWVWSTTLTPGGINIITQPETQNIKKDNSGESRTKPLEIKDQIETKKNLASLKAELPKSSRAYFNFLIAFGLAIFAGLMIFLLKKNLKLR